MNVKVTAKSVIIECKLVTITDNSVLVDLKDKYNIGEQYLHKFNYEDEEYTSIYNINKISVKDNKVFLIEKELNDVYMYFLPTLNLSKQYLLTEYMYDCRIKDDLVYLFYRFVPYEDYLTKRDKLQYLHSYINCIIPDDKRLECFVFKLNFMQNILNIQNNVAEFDFIYKDLVGKFHGYKSLPHNIVSNTIEFRQEFADNLGVSINDLPELLKDKYKPKENEL